MERIENMSATVLALIPRGISYKDMFGIATEPPAQVEVFSSASASISLPFLGETHAFWELPSTYPVNNL